MKINNIKMENRDLIEKNLNNGLRLAEQFITKEYLSGLTDKELITYDSHELDYKHMQIYKLNKVVFNHDENMYEKLVNVYSALYNFNSSVVLIINSDGVSIDFYIGVRSPGTSDTAGKILRKSFMGNFPGSILVEMASEKNKNILEQVFNKPSPISSRCVAAVSIIPSIRNENQNQNNYIQGIEKFIESMNGEKYTALFISSPVISEDLMQRKKGLEQLYSILSPFAKTTITYGENSSNAIANGLNENFASTINESITDTTGSNIGESYTKSKGRNFGAPMVGFHTGSVKSNASTTSKGESYSQSKAETKGQTTSSGSSKVETTSSGESWTTARIQENKTIVEVLKKIELQLDRFYESEVYGVWESSSYFIADNIETSMVASSTFKALVSGSKSNAENSFINVWNDNIKDQKATTWSIIDTINHGLHPKFKIPSLDGFREQVVSTASIINGKEMPVQMGIPKNSISGVTTIDMTSFGRNVRKSTIRRNGKEIGVGCIYHMGQSEKTVVKINLNTLASHCFVTGATGSGKSNAVYCMIDELIKNDIPFLAIEPAKGEYRKDFGNVKNIGIYCTNSNLHHMLRLNPFEFHSSIHITEHLDRLIDIFNACWPLYAAMPAILKMAIEIAYKRCGWDINNNKYIDIGKNKFPTFNSVLEVLPELIDNSSYSSTTKGDYTGALVTRIVSLTTGLSGQVLCSGPYGISDAKLFDNNCIVDLTHVGSTETRSLIMGILILKLTEYRRATEKSTNNPLKHVTILEEAHNILKKTSQAQSQESENLQGKSVEMITQSIKEMRTYGEGFLIIDQSPSEVDDNAISNTNTKIILRLPSSEDCIAVGKSMSLNDRQINEISRLETGVAVTYQSDWIEAVLTKFHKYSGKYYDSDVVASSKDIIEVKSKIVYELISQFKDNNINISFLNTIINRSSIPICKKDDIRQYLSSNLRTMQKSKKINSDLFRHFLCGFINAQDMFDIIPLNLSKTENNSKSVITNDDKSDIFLWFSQMIILLDNFIFLENINDKEFVLLRMLLEKAENTKNANYYNSHYYMSKRISKKKK